MEWKFIFSNPTYGTVTTDEPIGWADIAINVKRDMSVHGLFFDFALDLKFIDSGYTYLQNAYDTGGIDQYVELLVQVKCDQQRTFTDFYKGKMLLAKLIFDCSDFCFAQCTIEPSGCLMKFKNRIDQKVDLQLCEDYDKNALPCYNFLPYNIQMKPKLVKKLTSGTQTTAVLSNCVEFFDAVTAGSGCEAHDKRCFIEPFIESYTYNEVQNTDALYGTMSDLLSDINPFLTPILGGTFKLTVKLNSSFQAFFDGPFTGPNATCGCSGNATIPPNTYSENACLFHEYFNDDPTANRVNFRKTNGLELDFVIQVNGTDRYRQNLDLFAFACSDYYINNFCVDYQDDIILSANDVLKVYFDLHISSTFDRQALAARPVSAIFGYVQKASDPGYCDNVKIEVESSTLEPATDSKAYMINEAFSRITENITNDCIRVKSDYFGRTDSQPYTSLTDGCGALESITVGKHLRQFPNNLCLMNPSFKDLFDSMNAIHNIGYAIEKDPNRLGYDLLRIEPMSYFYNATVLMQCDNIPALKKSVKAEWYISLFEFGYEKWEAEQTSGLDEFCVKKQYRATFSEIKKNEEHRCKFIGSGYAIENTRAEKYLIDTTKDWRWDNDIFVICVRRDGTATAPYSLISVEQGADCINVGTATNIIDPATIYNARISPNRNFLRWLPYLMSNYAFDINDPLSYFRFVDGQGNYLAEMELINGCLYEKSGVNLKENQDIDSGDVNTPVQAYPIYKFELIEYDYPMSLDEFTSIQVNPRGTIEYRTRNDKPFEKGYIYSLSYKPNEGIATFNLLPKHVP